MLSALLFGLAASSALVIGGVAGAFWRPPRPLVAVALACASGALITALAFDLFEESFRAGGVWFSGLGLLAGAAAFIGADEWLDHHIERAGGGVSGFAILAAVTLDGIPENMALGVTLLEGTGSVVLLVAIFASNLPESLGGAVGMREEGRSEGFVILIWLSAPCSWPPAWSSVTPYSWGRMRGCSPFFWPSPAARYWPRSPTPSCPTPIEKAAA